MKSNTQKNTKMIYLSIDMFSYQSTSIKKLQDLDYLLNMNGGHSEYSNLEDGFTMKFTSQSPSFFYSDDQSALTPLLDSLQ